MYPLDLKTQNSFTVPQPAQANMSALQKQGGLALAGQTVYPVQRIDKSQGSMDHGSRIFSPYLTPSAVYTENRQISQGSLAPTYQQNIAATKYYNVSTTPKLRPHLHTNLIA